MGEAPVIDEAGFEVLSRSECLRLLERGGLGQVTLPGDDDTPAVRPVNFVLDGDRIVMRTGNTRLWRAATEKRGASFGVDEGRNLDHTGWSVIVTGHLELLPADERVRALPLRSWAPTERHRFVALAVQEATGRRSARPTVARKTRDAVVDATGSTTGVDPSEPAGSSAPCSTRSTVGGSGSSGKRSTGCRAGAAPCWWPTTPGRSPSTPP